jgi:hypothetical protein
MGPELGAMLVIAGGGVTVKSRPLLATLATVTTTLPVVAPEGTVTLMPDAVQLDIAARVPLNVTALLPWVDPKFEPFIVKPAPIGPWVRLKLAMLGPGAVTVKSTPLLEAPATVTTIFPDVAPLGTGTTMLVEVQVVGVPVIALNVTVLDPWLAPKFAPVIVTEVPRGPDVGLMLVMLGAVITVKLTPLLATPPTVTTTGPVVAPAGTGAMMLVALQFDTVAVVPLNVIVLVPCEVPKLEPVIVIAVPGAPDVWLKLVMLGAVPPPPLAALNAATTAPQASDADRDAAAEVRPALVCIW